MFRLAASRLVATSSSSSLAASRAAFYFARASAGCGSSGSTASYHQRFFHATPEASAKLNVEQLAEKVDLRGANVLVRVDLNVPLAKVRILFCSTTNDVQLVRQSPEGAVRSYGRQPRKCQ